jgi:hypothetical protein
VRLPKKDEHSIQHFSGMEKQNHEQQVVEHDPAPPDTTDTDLDDIKESNGESNTGKELDSSALTIDNLALPEYEYITGLKMFLVMAAVTLVIFLMMLDMSIVVTVSSYYYLELSVIEILMKWQGYSSNH